MPTVLVIDDSPTIHQVVRRATRIVRDWRFLTALDGVTGLQMLREHLHQIDAILLDVIMPDIDGRWVCARIRQLCPTMPIVPFTAEPDTVPVLLEEFDCAPALIKPVSITAMVAALQEAINHRTSYESTQASALRTFVQNQAAEIERRALSNRGGTRISDPGTTIERQLIPGVQLDDLNLNQVRDHIATAIELRGYDGPTDPLEYLRRYGCVVESELEVFVPTLIGVLAFTAEPDRWLGAAGIDIASFKGRRPNSGDISFHKEVRGNIFQQIDRAVDLLWAITEHGYRIDVAQRVEEHAFPIAVIREATINALCHRHWGYAGSLVRIQKFRDRIEWISPGGLPLGVTIENLRTAQVSRNRDLAQILYHGGYVERFGMGIDTVLDTLAALGSEPPAFHDDGHFFTLCVWSKVINNVPESLSTAMSERYAAIMKLVRQRGSVTLSDIEAILQGVTRRTIQRSLQELVDQGQLRAVGATSKRSYQLGSVEE
jgi:predicted HTH transcriptional regulator/CheY-like chemotaxis protein